MQSRRHEDFASFNRSRRNTEIGPDGYGMMSPPRRTEVPQYSERVLAGRRSISLERRRAVDDGSRRIRSRSRSPAYMDVKRTRAFNNQDWVAERDLLTPERRSRYELIDRVSLRNDVIDDKFDGRRLDNGMHEIGDRKSTLMGLHRSAEDVGPTYRTERGADFASGSLNIGLGPIAKERVQYPEVRRERVQYPDVRDSSPFDEYTATKQYGDMEKTVGGLRDSYYDLSKSRVRGSMDASHFRDYSRISPRKSRDDHLGYRDGIPLAKDNNPLNSVHISTSLSHSRYEQPHHLDVNADNMGRFRRETFTPPRTGNLDSSRLQPRTRERDEYLYPSEELYGNMNMRERVDLDYRGRDILKPNVLEHVTNAQRAETSDFVRRNMNNRSSLDHVSLEKLTGSNNIGFNRSPGEKREFSQYLDDSSIHSRLGKRISREDEMAYIGMPQDREIERDYDHKREIGSGSYMERMRSPPRVLYHSERSHKMETRDLSPYDSSPSRFLKRKYSMDEEQNRITSRSMMNRHTRDYSNEEWINQDARGSNLSSRRDHTHGFSRRVGPDYDSELIIHDHEGFSHDHPMKSYKYEDKNDKGYSRSGGRDEYNSYHPNRRNVLQRGKNVPIRREHGKDIMYPDEQYEDYGSCVKSNEHEDSEKFKELVHDFFLSFTKKLNENSGLRRRYMEQGQAGSLFCIVCGRSLSKEFLDTQRLAMHAFMSPKSGLRAQHLGLVKAICVMLGWNSTIPAQTIRWFPEPLSSSQAWAQKEDLIIWPPVIIIHNTSILSSDSNGQGPTSLEALGQFLRGKGLSGGKVKPGKLANCSIMLVKFLGTFSGLKEAEKMHQYFLKNKHGRKDLDRITSSKGKNKTSNGEEAANKNNDKEADKVVFGYMGIAEDLEKVDLDSKKKCVIKSKKEIQDLADGPVKPE